jgi:hypothetical protein
MTQIKKLYLDVSGNDATENLMQLHETLEQTARGEDIVGKAAPKLLDIASPETHRIKLMSMLNDIVGGSNYIIGQFSNDHDMRYSAIAADDLVRKINHGKIITSIGVDVRNVQIPQLGVALTYSNEGQLLSLESNGSYPLDDLTRFSLGKDVLHFLSCCVEQDVALVFKKKEDGKESLEYVFDCSMYEKTPKDPVTGYNHFLGKDLLEFHGHAKTYGHILPTILGNLTKSLEIGTLDMLAIDLRGQNTHELYDSDGNVQEGIEARRFERDYITALRVHCDGQDVSIGCEKCPGQFKGILAYADVLFQELSDTSNPFEGGTCLDKSLYNRLKVVNKPVGGHHVRA